MKKLFSLALALVLLFGILSFSACAPGGPKVAFLIYDGKDTFIAELMEKVQQDMPAGIAYEIREAGNSQARQNQQITELIESGVSLLVVNAVDRLACNSIVEKCQTEGVDVIFFNREPLEDALTGGENIYYVGADADSLGKKQADMVAPLFGGGRSFDKNGDGVIQLVIIKGEQGHQDAEKRTDNCVLRLKALGFETEVLAIDSAGWMRREGYDAMQRLYADYGEEIELVFANNDDMALGAIDYFLDEGIFKAANGEYGQPFVVAGVDGTQVGMEAISDGLLYGTVLNDSAKQADAILCLIDHLLNKKDMDDFPYTVKNGHYIYIDGDIITNDNLAEYTS